MGCEAIGRAAFYTAGTESPVRDRPSLAFGASQSHSAPQRNYLFLVLLASLMACCASAAFSYFLVKRSTRPAVSSSFCLPVKNGWQFEQISTRRNSPFIVDRVGKVCPQAQCTVTGW